MNDTNKSASSEVATTPAMPAHLAGLSLEVTFTPNSGKRVVRIVREDGYPVSASKYDEWLLGCQLMRHISDTKSMFENFEIWSKAAVEANGLTWGQADSDSCKARWDRVKIDKPAPTIEQRFHAGDVSTDEAIEMLADSPVVQKIFNDHYDCELSRDDLISLLASIANHGRQLQILIHGLNVAANWWSDLETGEPKERNDGELCMLVVTEISEGFEGVRKNLMDDKLGHRKMFEVELADAVIRENDICGGRGFDLMGALFEKLAFNQVRADHKRENRLLPNGKKC